MAEVLVFHHAQGLTPGVVAFATRCAVPDIASTHPICRRVFYDFSLTHSTAVTTFGQASCQSRPISCTPRSSGRLLFQFCEIAYELCTGHPRHLQHIPPVIPAHDPETKRNPLDMQPSCKVSAEHLLVGIAFLQPRKRKATVS